MKFCLALTGLLTTAAISTLHQDELSASASSFYETKPTPKKLSIESSKASVDAHFSIVNQRKTRMGFSDEDINDLEDSTETDLNTKRLQSSLDKEIHLASSSHPSSKAEASLSVQGFKTKGLDSIDKLSSHPSLKAHSTSLTSTDARSAILDFLSIPNSLNVPLATAPDETQNNHLPPKASEKRKDSTQSVPSDAPQDIKKTKPTSEISPEMSKRAKLTEKAEEVGLDSTSRPSKVVPEETPKATAISSPQPSTYSKKFGQEAQNTTRVNAPGVRPSAQSVRSLPNAPAVETKPSSPIPETAQSLAKNVLPVAFTGDKKPDGLNAKKNDYTPIIKLAILSSAIEEAKSTAPPIMTTAAPLATGTSNPPKELSASSTGTSPVETSFETEAPRTTQILTTPNESPKEDQENGLLGFEACASYQRFCRDILCSGAEEVEIMDCNDGGTCQCKPDSDPIKSHGITSESASEPQEISYMGRNSTFRNSRSNTTKAYLSASSSSTHIFPTVPTIVTYLAIALSFT